MPKFITVTTSEGKKAYYNAEYIYKIVGLDLIPQEALKGTTNINGGICVGDQNFLVCETPEQLLAQLND